MRRPGSPPRLARWLLERVLPADVREDVSGDLHEMFLRRQHEGGRAHARRWYWRQSPAFAMRFLAERLKEQRRSFKVSTTMSWIDVKLALRMLVRYPGLTIVSVLGMAVGMMVAGAFFTIGSAMMDPRLPLPDSERIVSIGHWDVATNNREQRALHDLASWRTLQSVEDLGAFRTVSRNLVADGGQPEAVSLAEISASGFRVAGVAPLLGRHLLPQDESPGAPDVVVIGHDLWTRRFSGDPGIIGRDIRLGDRAHTIVGVMPADFGFPINHSLWIPWRLDAAVYQPRTGPTIYVFGRLTSTATLESAQSELTAIGQRAAAASPATHEHLRPRVIPYAYAFTDMDDPESALMMHAMQTATVMLLVLVCLNVAILVYARTATRLGEIAVRSALGASRRRVVVQLFVEALVLAAVAAMLGIGLLSVGLRQFDAALAQMAGRPPFWIRFQLSAEEIVYIAALTVLAAGIVGIVPALKATGRKVQTRLQGISAGSGSRMQMGRLWTTLIVAQVAVAVTILPAAMYHSWTSLRFRTADPGFAIGEFLTTDLLLDRASSGRPPDENEAAAFTSQFALQQAELERRLEADAAVGAVTFSMVAPGGELALVLEVAGASPPIDPVDYNIVEGSKRGYLVRFNRVATDFFEAFEVPVVMGRGLRASDAVRGANGVLVNRTFVERVFGGENPLGQRVQYVGRSREADAENVSLNRWYEIVGVVPDFPLTNESNGVSRVYHAAAPGDVYPPRVAIRVRDGSPSAFAGRLREIAAAANPNLQLRDISSADEARKREQSFMRLIGVTLAVVMLSVLGLSAGGIYALMAFTVTRRRKEIGIRAALGADASRILSGIFSRVFAQLGAGAALGIVGAAGIEMLLAGEMLQGQGALLLPLVALLMTTVGVLAAVGPARRGLAIQPTEALRED